MGQLKNSFIYIQNLENNNAQYMFRYSTVKFDSDMVVFYMLEKECLKILRC